METSIRKKVLILYSSVDGHTSKISQYLNQQISIEYEVTVASVVQFKSNLESFDFVVLGSSIRYGKHSTEFLNFIQENETKLKTLHSAFFSVNLVARKVEKSTSATNPYVLKFLNETQWKPKLVGVFAGVLDYKKYSTKDRVLIKLIMLITGGPLRTKVAIEYTNWLDVSRFALEIKSYIREAN
jgi:menaquinone-dependent protoporphyrinogen oxidase